MTPINGNTLDNEIDMTCTMKMDQTRVFPQNKD